MASASLLQSALYTANESPAAQANASQSLMQSALYPVVNSQQSPSSFLGGIGNEFEGLAQDSSGIGGLFLPALAQNMQTNSTPIVQNQLDMSMAYPPALLQKMMMGSGGVPSITAAQDLGIQGTPSLRAIPAAVGKYGQDLLKSLPSSGSLLGPMLPKEFPQLAQDYEKGIAPVTDYHLNQALGVKNNPANKFVESGIEQAIPLMGMMPGLRGGVLDGATESLPMTVENIASKEMSPTSLGEKISEAMTHKLIHEDIPRHYNLSKLTQQKAYSPYTDLLDNPGVKVDDSPWQINNFPKSDEELRGFLPKIQTSYLDSKFDPLNHPDIKSMALKNWQQANPPHVFDPKLRSGLRRMGAQDFYDRYMQTKNGRDLANLNQQLGYASKFGGLPGDTRAQETQRLAKQGYSQTKQMLESHANQNGVLQDKKAGDLITKQIIKPMEKTQTLRNIINKNITDRTPQEFVRLTRPLLEGNTKLAPDDPIAETIGNLKQQIKNEKIKQPTLPEAKQPLSKRIFTAALKQSLPGRVHQFYKDIK